MSGFTIGWLAFAVVLALVEAATMGLVSIWFCIGAVAAAITANFTNSVFIQCCVFVAVSGVALAVTRPLVKKWMKTGATPTNADRIIGSEGVVTLDINPTLRQGQINVAGQIWSAKSETNAPIPSGTLVEVTAIEGVRAVVKTK